MDITEAARVIADHYKDAPFRDICYFQARAAKAERLAADREDELAALCEALRSLCDEKDAQRKELGYLGCGEIPTVSIRLLLTEDGVIA